MQCLFHLLVEHAAGIAAFLLGGIHGQVAPAQQVFHAGTILA
jgi:hypothetical protein